MWLPAAAAEQLGEWARRSGAVMGPFKEGARPQEVIGQVRVNTVSGFKTCFHCFQNEGAMASTRRRECCGAGNKRSQCACVPVSSISRHAVECCEELYNKQ